MESDGPALDLSDVALELLDALPDSVLVLDADWRIVLANVEAEAMFRFEPGSLVGTELESLVPDALREHQLAQPDPSLEETRRQTIGAGGEPLTAMTSHGSLFRAEIRLSPYQHGNSSYVLATVRNVSERVELDLVHRRTLASLDALTDPVMIIDPSRLWIGYANEGACSTTGYPMDQLTSMTPLALLPDLGRDELLALVATARDRSEASVETELRCSDGRRLPLALRAVYVDGGGDASVCVLFGRDMSEVRSAEDRHQALIDQLRRAAVAADISIWSLNVDGAIRSATGAEWRSVGRLADAVGRHVEDVFAELPDVTAAFTGALEGRDASAMVDVGAESRLVRFQPVVGSGAKVVEVVGTAVDVGELQAARRADGLKRDRLSTLAGSISQGMLIVTSEGEVLETNPAFCAMVARTRAEVLESRWPFPFVSEMEDVALFEATWAIIANSGHLESTTDLIRPDGARVPVTLTADRVTGRPGQALVLFSDLSARQRFETDLNAANAVLAAADDRERIARDLHDRVIQRIFATGILLQSSQNRTSDPHIVVRLRQAVDELDLVIRELRTSVFELAQKPSGGASGVRSDVLSVIAETTRVLGFRPDLRFEGVIEDLDVDVELDLLAVLRESLTNVARHAGATSASVAVTTGKGILELVVADNGIGADQTAAHSGHGVTSMIGRAEGRNGGCDLRSEGPGKGSTLRWWVPL